MHNAWRAAPHATWRSVGRPATWRTPSARMQQLGTPSQPGTSKHRKKKKRCVSLRFPQALRADHDTSTTDAQHHGSSWPAPTSRQKTSRTQQIFDATTSKSAKNKDSLRRLVFDLLTSVKTLYCNGLSCVAAMSRATSCGTSKQYRRPF